jgi:D-alanine-D-alanine ligase
MSSEREVSLKSGEGVARALIGREHDVRVLDLDDGLYSSLLSFRPEMVYIALHGAYGEDGRIQGMLEIMGLKYTGSGVLASAVALDKVLSKKLFGLAGIPTPRWALACKEDWDKGLVDLGQFDFLGFPMVVKPSREGSSFGMSIVRERKGTEAALRKAFACDREVLLEEYIAGKEITVGVLGNECLEYLPPIEIVPKNEFYDYESKYAPGGSEHIIPARIPEEVLVDVGQLAVAAHRAIGCRAFSRVDLMLDQDNRPYVLEVNTLPGMTETSLLPDAARAIGLDYADLVEKILQLSAQ